MDIVKLEELAAGAVQEQFNRSFHKVLDNLQNPNTPCKVKRSITIKVDFVQNEQRDDVKTSIQVSEKLAPQSPIETAFSIGKNLRTGETILKSGRATIVFWKDGSKTVVKLPAGEESDDYSAFTAALAKKIYGSNSAIKKIIVAETVVQEKKEKMEENE